MGRGREPPRERKVALEIFHAQHRVLVDLGGDGSRHILEHVQNAHLAVLPISRRPEQGL